MEKKVTISNKSKIVAFFDELSKKKEDTKVRLTAKLTEAGIITNSHAQSKIGR